MDNLNKFIFTNSLSKPRTKSVIGGRKRIVDERPECIQMALPHSTQFIVNEKKNPFSVLHKFLHTIPTGSFFKTFCRKCVGNGVRIASLAHTHTHTHARQIIVIEWRQSKGAHRLHTLFDTVTHHMWFWCKFGDYVCVGAHACVRPIVVGVCLACACVCDWVSAIRRRSEYINSKFLFAARSSVSVDRFKESVIKLSNVPVSHDSSFTHIDSVRKSARKS